MIYMWNVFVGGTFYGVVGSMTEQGAIDKFYNRYGTASRYSGLGRDQITVERI